MLADRPPLTAGVIETIQFQSPVVPGLRDPLVAKGVASATAPQAVAPSGQWM